MDCIIRFFFLTFLFRFVILSASSTKYLNKPTANAKQKRLRPIMLCYVYAFYKIVELKSYSNFILFFQISASQITVVYLRNETIVHMKMARSAFAIKIVIQM